MCKFFKQLLFVKNSCLVLLLVILIFGPALNAVLTLAVASVPEKCEPLTKETARLIQQGKIWWVNPKHPDQKFLDSLLVNHPALDPQADDDGDGISNQDEICVYRVGGQNDTENGQNLRLHYHSHPLLADTDGDGIKDGQDKNPLRWDVSTRDAILFQELSYRNASYVRKVLDDQTVFLSSDWYQGRAEYGVMYKELAPYWEVAKVWDTDDGFDATLFRFSNKTLPFLEDGSVHVLGVRGTGGDGGGDGDLANDIRLGLGIWPWQANTALDVADELTAAGYQNLSITGHSLGGYLAQIISVRMAGQRYANPANNPNRENYNQFDTNKKNNPNYVKTYTFNAPGMNGNRWLWEYRTLGRVLSELNGNENYKTGNDTVPGRLEPTIWLERSDNGHGSRSFMETRYMDRPGFSIGNRRGFGIGEGYRDPKLDDQSIFVKPTTLQFVTVEPDGKRIVRNEQILAKTQAELWKMDVKLPTQIQGDYQEILERPPLRYGENNQIVVRLKQYTVTYEFRSDNQPLGELKTIAVQKYGSPYQPPGLPKSGTADWRYRVENIQVVRSDTGENVDWLLTGSEKVPVPTVDLSKIKADTKILVNLDREFLFKDLRLIFKDSQGKEIGRFDKQTSASEENKLKLLAQWAPIGYEYVNPDQKLVLDKENEVLVRPLALTELPKTGSSGLIFSNLAAGVLIIGALLLRYQSS